MAKIKTEHFECGYSIYQIPDGRFKVYTLDSKGKRTEESEPLEFYANAVCALIQRLMTEEGEDDE
jgi:hypothetical protein